MSQTGMAFDLSGFLANAEKADKKLQDMVAHSRRLKENLDSALNGQSATSFLSVLDRIKNTMTGLNGMRVSAFDTKNIEEAYTAMDRVVTVVKTMSQQKGAVLFDTQSLYATDQGVLQLGEKLKNINNEMSRVRKEWSELSTFQAPVNTRTGKEFKPESKTYQAAEANYRAEREAQMRLLIEKKAIASQELNWAKMTQDEKLAYIEKALQKELQAEQRRVNEARKEYRALVKEQLDITKKNDKLQKSGIGAAGAPMQREYEQQFLTLDARRKELETQYGQFVVDIARNAQRQVLDLEVKRIQDRLAAEKAAEEQRRSTPQGALDLANNAKTINEMREAQKYLTTARDNTDVKDTKTIDTLNQAYQRLRVQIEQLTTAEKNEQTLQPTIRNEYARMLKELDKLTAAKKKASETEAYKTGNAQAQQNYADIEARERDVRNKILEIEKNSQGMLDEVKRQHRANNAMLEVAETQKVEQQKAEIARKRYEEQRAAAQQVETWSSNKVGQVIGQTTNAANVAQQEAAIKKLTEARKHLDQNDAKYEATLKKLNAEIKRHEHNMKMATDATYRKKQAEKDASSPANALAYARSLESGVKSINSMNLALQRLKNAQKDLDLNTKQGRRNYFETEKEIKRIEQALGGVQDKNRGVADTAGQLKRAFASVFSISAVKGYITKLIEVRGELELQQTALRAIVQNKQEADLIWKKVTALAVHSPFSVQQLVTYTKQLAAYRVETEKLYDTTKMLADVSAGLGVDMGRLILAFGQVKAANYLRGTELRQFTEAGVNMLQELVWYFEEVEGKSYTVAQIFEMISKRKVTFEAVEQVFQRMTSEGGLFFDMQSKQAETLKGKMSNLKDSITLMFNEMGEKNSGVLHGFLSDLKDIIDNWEYWASIAMPLINALIIRFALLKTAMAVSYIKYYFGQFLIGLVTATASTISFKAALSSLMSVNVVGWIIMIIGVVAALTNAFRGTQSITEKYTEFVANAKNETEELVDNYKKLVDTINDATESTQKRDAAYKELVRTYGDYFTQQELERENIEALNGEYDKQIARLRLLRQEKEREQVIADLKNSRPDYALENMQRLYAASYSGVKGIAVWKAEFDRMTRAISEGVSAYEAWEDFTAAVGIRDAADPPGQFYSWDRWTSTMFNPTSSNLLKQQNSVVEYITVLEEASKDELAIIKRIISQRERTASNANLFSKGFYSTEDVNNELLSLLQGSSFSYLDKDGEVRLRELTQDEQQYLQNYIQTLDIYVSDFEKNYQAILNRLFKFENISEEYRRDIQALFSKTTNFDAHKAVEGLLKEYKEQIEKFQNAQATGDITIAPISQEQHDALSAMIPNLTLLFNYLGGSLEKNSGGTNKALQKLKDQIAFIRQLADDYDELLEKFGKKYADENIWTDARKAAAKELGLKPQDLKVGTQDKYGYDEKNNLESLLTKAKKVKGGLLELNKAIADVNVELDVDVQVAEDEKLERAIESLFDKYELSVEFEKLNLSETLAKNFLGFDRIDLDAIRPAVLGKFKLDAFANKTNEDIYGSTEFKNLNKEQKEILQQALEEEEKLQKKRKKQQLEDFKKYLKDATDEIRLVQNEGAINLSLAKQYFAEGKITAEQYAEAVTRITRDVNNGVSKINLERFKESDTYIAAMGNLAEYTTIELQEMLNKLKDVIATSAKAMDVNEIKEYYKVIERLQKSIDDKKSPISKNEFAKLREYLQLSAKLQEQIGQKDEFEGRREMLQSSLQTAEKLLAIETDETKTSNLQQQIEMYTRLISQTDGSIASATENISLISGQMSSLAGGATGALAIVDIIIKGVSQTIEAAGKIFDDIKSLAESYGEDIENEGWRKSSKVFEIIGNVNQEITQGWENFKSGNIAGAIANTVGSITKLIQGINEYKDIDNQEEIERETKLVEKLAKAYDELSESIKNAYDMDKLNKLHGDAIANLEEQIQRTERMIELEKDKKNPDDEVVEKLREEKAELDKAKKELNEQMLEASGGFGSDKNVKSAAESFVDAWLQAYKETGDGLDALNKKFDEYYEEFIKKQLLLQGTSKYLDVFFNKFDAEIAGIGKTTDAATVAKNIGELWKNTSGDLDAFLSALAEALNIAETLGDYELSGLQEGISGITEEQADILAAYWSNVSLYTYDTNQKVNEIATKLFSTEADTNPMLSYLKTIAQQTTAIRNLFDDMLTQNTNKFVKVKMIG